MDAAGELVSAEDQLSSPLLASSLAVSALVSWSEAIVQFDVNTLIVPGYFVSLWFLKATKSMRRK